MAYSPNKHIRSRLIALMLGGSTAALLATPAAAQGMQDQTQAPAPGDQTQTPSPDQAIAPGQVLTPNQSTDPDHAPLPPGVTQPSGAAAAPPTGGVPLAASGTGPAVAPAVADTPGVVVTGLRRSIETAQALKFNADQFVDSVTATDIGKLPDKNVAEALQRISGVQISRNYGEGSNIAIRGLTQVKTELNGRDVFGGSNGRALSFEDVPSELLAGVDVYKDPSAIEIEGGIGGLVNLRTRMPFDQKGFLLAASVGANYFDLADDARFNGSALVSKTWEHTGIGRIGFLFDISDYRGVFRRDQVGIEPYVPVTTVPGHEGQTLYMPDGAGIQLTQGNRKRRGYYGAVQWAPADNLEVYGTYFRSSYDIYTPNYSSFVTNGTSTDYLKYMQPNAASSFNFTPDGTFVSGGYNGFRPAYTGIPDPAGTIDPNTGRVQTIYVNTQLNVANNTQVHGNQSVTTDYAGGVKWSPTDRLHATVDLQYVRATAKDQSYTAFAQKDFAGYTIDLSGDLPSVTFQTPPAGQQGSASIYDPAAYRFTAVMDHFENSVATQKAGRVDLTWDFDNGGVLDSLRAGFRYSDRDAINRSTPYNWTAASPTEPDGSPLNLADPISRGVPAPYSPLFNGKSTIIGPVPYSDYSLFSDPAAAFQTIGGRALSTFGPLDVNTQQEKTYAGYAAAYFTVDAGLRVDGNVAVRVIRTDNDASGNTRLTYRPNLLPTTDTITQYVPYSADQSYTKVLPSVNLRVHVTPRLQVRAAASKGLSRPDFSQLNPNRSFSVGYTQLTDPTGAVIGYQPNNTNNGNGGNPMLKPLTVDQADLAVEWNASRSTFLYGTLFYKKLKNFIYQTTTNVTYPVPGQADRTFQTTNFVNGTRGKVQGAEIGGNTFFDFLPGALSGIGVQANATYVDSNAPGQSGVLQNGQEVPTTLQGLSKWSYNLVGLYEKYGISARAAYNWRSSYLADSAGNGTGGIPIYNHAYGQLDASLTFNFTPKVSMTVDATNLTKSRYDSYQYYPQDPRVFELDDRRFGVTFRMRT